MHTVYPQMLQMQINTDIRQAPLSSDMQVLLRDYPRDTWPENPNFARSIQNWMGAHQGFRQLAHLCVAETQRFIDRENEETDYADRLGYFGNMLVRNLHGHHHWEDHSFFPELSEADARFDPGIEVLESDHETLDATLDTFTRASNRVIKLIHLDPKQARDEIAKVENAASTIDALLKRHLADEEDLVVPIILHHKLRG